MEQAGESKELTVPVSGVRHLRLEVVGPGYNGQAHAIWLNPRLTRVGEDSGSKKTKKKD
jgi:hypothetical protein